MSSAHEGRKCPYAANCFECPLPDCKAGVQAAMSYNRLPHERYGSELRRKWAKTMKKGGVST